MLQDNSPHQILQNRFQELCKRLKEENQDKEYRERDDGDSDSDSDDEFEFM